MKNFYQLVRKLLLLTDYFIYYLIMFYVMALQYPWYIILVSDHLSEEICHF